MNAKKPSMEGMQAMMLTQSQQATEALERDIQPHSHSTVERHDQRLNVLLISDASINAISRILLNIDSNLPSKHQETPG
ncbi:hypothetical protein BTI87_08900 [Lactobacillus delbrueckii subsp. bulgaricus]|nr:hypothetical protein [Lactobacillus delbrueckii subsp. bulgaricus]